MIVMHCRQCIDLQGRSSTPSPTHTIFPRNPTVPVNPATRLYSKPAVPKAHLSTNTKSAQSSKEQRGSVQPKVRCAAAKAIPGVTVRLRRAGSRNIGMGILWEEMRKRFPVIIEGELCWRNLGGEVGWG